MYVMRQYRVCLVLSNVLRVAIAETCQGALVVDPASIREKYAVDKASREVSRIAAEVLAGINKAVPTFNSSSFVFNLGSLNIVFFGLDAMIEVVSITLIVTHIAAGATFLVATFSMSARVQALHSLIPIGTRA